MGSEDYLHFSMGRFNSVREGPRYMIPHDPEGGSDEIIKYVMPEPARFEEFYIKPADTWDPQIDWVKITLNIADEELVRHQIFEDDGLNNLPKNQPRRFNLASMFGGVLALKGSRIWIKLETDGNEPNSSDINEYLFYLWGSWLYDVDT